MYSTEKPTTIPAAILSIRPRNQPKSLIKARIPITIPIIDIVEYKDTIQLSVEQVRTTKAKAPVQIRLTMV